MADVPLDIPHGLEAWANARIAEGRYEDIGDYVRHLIRRDLEQAERANHPLPPLTPPSPQT